MKLVFGTAALVASALAMAAPANATVIFGSAQIYTSSNAYAYGNSGNGGSASSSSSDSDSAYSVPSIPLEATSFTSATSVTGKRFTPTATANNGEDATATFVTAATGNISYSGSSIATVITPTNANAYAGAYGYDQFNYNFTIDQDAKFTIDFLTSDNGLYSGYGSYFSVSGPSYLSDYFPQNTTGSFTTDLLAGSYSFAIYDYYYHDYAYQSGAAGTFSAQRDDSFSFNIVSSVPESATWAMMLAGFAMIGFAARHSQKVKTTVTYA